jgi:integrase
MKKRTYGTGTLRKIHNGKWLLEYKPKWAKKRLSKTVEAPTEKAAGRLLSDWVTALDKQTAPEVSVSIVQLVDIHVADMRVKDRDPQNIVHVEQRCRKHLVSFFGTFDFSQPLKKAEVKRYADARLKSGAARATINRELSALKRMLRLANEEELICVPVPKIEKLPENNVRTGFVDNDAYRAMLAKLPAHQKMLWAFGYRLGIRKGELLKLRWEWLLPYWQLEEPYIKIPGFDGHGRVTKSGKPHTIPIHHPELRALVAIAITQREPKCPWMFQYRGKRLKNTRSGFEKAREEAGLEGLIFHDTRRTAVRRMEDAGIPRREAMQITGHRTEQVYKRYDIGAESGATEAGKRLREYELSKDRFANRFANEQGDADASRVN